MSGVEFLSNGIESRREADEAVRPIRIGDRMTLTAVPMDGDAAGNPGGDFLASFEVLPVLPILSVTATDPDASEDYLFQLITDYALFEVARSAATDELVVDVSFSGTADFNDDYIVEVSGVLSRTVALKILVLSNCLSSVLPPTRHFTIAC